MAAVVGEELALATAAFFVNFAVFCFWLVKLRLTCWSVSGCLLAGFWPVSRLLTVGCRSMARPEQEFFFTYSDIRALTGVSQSALSRDVRLGRLDPEILESVVGYVLANTPPDVRMGLMAAALGLPYGTKVLVSLGDGPSRRK